MTIPLWLMAWAFLFEMVIMTLVWIWALRVHNAGVVDIAWSFSLAVLVIFYALSTDGDALRRGTAVLMTGIWGFRLSWHLFKKNHGKPEDPRYQKIRAKWGRHQKRKLLSFYYVQGFVSVVLSVPFLLICANEATALTGLELVAFGFWIIAILGEMDSDVQLHRFKSDPSNRGKPCEIGFWLYSRHPNYFFEWLVWCAFALFAIASPFGWVAVLCPALMYHILVNVTGIPLAEEQALRSRGDLYRQYQKRTSPFFPQPPRRGGQKHVV